MRLLLAVVLACALLAVQAQPDPSIALTSGSALTVTPSTSSTKFFFKSSSSYQNSTIRVHVERVFGVGGLSASVTRCVYPFSGANFLDAFLPACSVGLTSSCTFFIPSCMIAPNTIFYIDVQVPLSQYRINVTEIPIVPVAMPAANADQTIRYGEDAYYFFDLPSNDTWVSVSITPNAANTAQTTLMILDGRIPEHQYCAPGRQTITATNTSVASITVSPTNLWPVFPACFLNAGRYYVHVRTDSPNAQTFTISHRIYYPDPPQLSATPTTGTVSAGADVEYSFNVSSTENVVRFVLTPDAGNTLPLRLYALAGSAPDPNCPLSDVVTCDIPGPPPYNHTACTIRVAPACGVENTRYFVRVRALNGGANQGFSITAEQGPYAPVDFPAGEQWVQGGRVFPTSDRIFVYNITDNTVQHTFTLSSSNLTLPFLGVVTMRIFSHIIPEVGCITGRTCNIGNPGATTCSITYSSTCGFEVGSYYIRISSSDVDNAVNFNLTHTQAPWTIYSAVNASLQTVMPQDDAIYQFDWTDNSTAIVINITSDVTSFGALQFFILRDEVPDPANGCDGGMNNINYNGGGTNSPIAPGDTRIVNIVNECGFYAGRHYLRVRTLSGVANFYLSITQSAPITATALPATQQTVVPGFDPLFSFTATDNTTSWLYFTINADPSNTAPVFIYTGLPWVPVTYPYAMQGPRLSTCIRADRSCQAPPGGSCTLTYSTTCGFSAGVYHVRVLAQGRNSQLYTISASQSPPSTQAPARDQLINATLPFQVYSSNVPVSNSSNFFLGRVLVDGPFSGTVSTHMLNGQVPDTCTPIACSLPTSTGVTLTGCYFPVSPLCGSRTQGTFNLRVFGNPNIINNYSVAMESFSESQVAAVPVPVAAHTLNAPHRSMAFFKASFNASSSKVYHVIVTNPAPGAGAITFSYGAEPWPLQGCSNTITCSAVNIQAGACTFGWTACSGTLYMSMHSTTVNTAVAGPDAALSITIAEYLDPTINSVNYGDAPVQYNTGFTLQPVVVSLPALSGQLGVQHIRFLVNNFGGTTSATVFVDVFEANDLLTCNGPPMRKYACQSPGGSSMTRCTVSVPACDLGKSGSNLIAVVQTTNLRFDLQVNLDLSLQMNTGQLVSNNMVPFERYQYLLPAPPENGWNTVFTSGSQYQPILTDTDCGNNYVLPTGTAHIRCYNNSQDSVTLARTLGVPASLNYLTQTTISMSHRETVPICMVRNYTDGLFNSETWFTFTLNAAAAIDVNISKTNTGSSFTARLWRECEDLGTDTVSFANQGHYYLPNAAAGKYYVQLLMTNNVRITVTVTGGDIAACPLPPVFSTIVCTWVEKDNTALTFCKDYVADGYYYIGPSPTAMLWTVAQAQAGAQAAYNTLYGIAEGQCNTSILAYSCEKYFTPCNDKGEFLSRCMPDCMSAFDGCPTNACMNPVCNQNGIGGSCAGLVRGSLGAASQLGLGLAALAAAFVALFL